MKRGDLIHIMWQHGHASNIHRGFAYEMSDGKTIGLNDLRAIWEYLNDDVPVECTIKNSVLISELKYPENERKKK